MSSPTPEHQFLLDRIARLEKALQLAKVHKNADKDHEYYGTHCHHKDHELCKVICKTCSSPCVCICHIPGYQGT